MSEQPEAVETEQQAPEAKDTELPKDIQEKLAELERLKGHHGKLLEETKTAKQKAAELEEAQRKSEEEALKKSGEFQKLYESESEKASRLQQELEEERASWREKTRSQQQKEIKSESIKAVHEIAVDEASLELLAEKVDKHAVYTDSGIEYEIGGVKVDRTKIIEMLSEKYPRLVKGSGAAGGGAAGGRNPSGVVDQNQAAQAAKNKGDLTGYLTAQLKS